MINSEAVARQVKKIENFVAAHPGDNIVAKLLEYRAGIEENFAKISRGRLSVAFIGKIGVGKTSAICRLLGLQNYDVVKGTYTDLLKTGSGRTTVCEVRVSYAETVSLSVEPLPEEEIKKIVTSFAEFIWAKVGSNISEDEEGGSLLSHEVTRCIRNMLGLVEETKKGGGGKIKRIDKALEFARNCASLQEVRDYMFQCLALEKRTASELTPDLKAGADWKDWLRETFSRVNGGKLENVSIPALMTVKGPFDLKRNDIEWTVIDTRGIDSNVRRVDIRQLLDSDQAIPVICSSFADAPDADARAIFEMAVDLGLKEKVERDAILLVLDKDEASKVSDIGDDVEDFSDRRVIGRILREDHVREKISGQFKIAADIGFFDSKLDGPDYIWGLLNAKKERHLLVLSSHIERFVAASDELINAEQAKSLAFQSEVDAIFQGWRSDADKSFPAWRNFGLDLIQHFRVVHHRTLAASIDRDGRFYNFHVYEAINLLIRSKAVSLASAECSKIRARFSVLNADYPEFVHRIKSMDVAVSSEFENFSVDAGTIAMDQWVSELGTDQEFWRMMSKEWGRGPGYVDRVAKILKDWVDSEPSAVLHGNINREIISRWGRVLAKGAVD